MIKKKRSANDDVCLMFFDNFVLKIPTKLCIGSQNCYGQKNYWKRVIGTIAYFTNKNISLRLLYKSYFVYNSFSCIRKTKIKKNQFTKFISTLFISYTVKLLYSIKYKLTTEQK